MLQYDNTKMLTILEHQHTRMIKHYNARILVCSTTPAKKHLHTFSGGLVRPHPFNAIEPFVSDFRGARSRDKKKKVKGWDVALV